MVSYDKSLFFSFPSSLSVFDEVKTDVCIFFFAFSTDQERVRVGKGRQCCRRLAILQSMTDDGNDDNHHDDDDYVLIYCRRKSLRTDFSLSLSLPSLCVRAKRKREGEKEVLPSF